MIHQNRIIQTALSGQRNFRGNNGIPGLNGSLGGPIVNSMMPQLGVILNKIVKDSNPQIKYYK